MKDTRNIIIVAGGDIHQEICEEYIKDSDDYIIGVDKGLAALDRYNIFPDLAVGDFDSLDEELKEKYIKRSNTIVLDTHKDLTDTHDAVLRALKLNPERITILGATGGRIDHLMGNIALLKLCVDKGVKAYIIDRRNRITMIDKQCEIKREETYGKYISFIPFSDRVTGVTLKGFEYPLTNATMIKEDSVGISNELREEEGLITIDTGYLLVMETKD